MADQVTLNRTVCTAECDWLDRDLQAGEVFYIYTGPTYGCIGYDGIALTEQEGVTPFFEVPFDAVRAAESSPDAVVEIGG